jgi:hypothetical protein
MNLQSQIWNCQNPQKGIKSCDHPKFQVGQIVIMHCQKFLAFVARGRVGSIDTGNQHVTPNL